MQYNTKRSRLLMPEYGRHIQEMVDYVCTISDPEQRQKQAQTIIELMGILNPHLKNVDDFKHKLWDHLFLISDFKIDVASPYPTPTREKLFKRPEPLPYPKSNLKHRHLGKNISKVIDKALAETDEEKKTGFSQAIAYCMKLAYGNWHNDPVNEDIVKEELYIISNGELSYDGASAKVKLDHRNKNNFKRNNNHGQNTGHNNRRNAQSNTNGNNGQQQRRNNTSNNASSATAGNTNNVGNDNNRKQNNNSTNNNYKKNNNNRRNHKPTVA